MSVFLYLLNTVCYAGQSGIGKYYAAKGGKAIVFNFSKTAAAALFFGIWCLLSGNGVHLPSLPWALAGGVCLAVSTHTGLLALSCGPMALTSILASMSLVIPFLWGIILWQEVITVFKSIGLMLLILCIVLICYRKHGAVSKKMAALQSDNYRVQRSFLRDPEISSAAISRSVPNGSDISDHGGGYCAVSARFSAQPGNGAPGGRWGFRHTKRSCQFLRPAFGIRTECQRPVSCDRRRQCDSRMADRHSHLSGENPTYAASGVRRRYCRRHFDADIKTRSHRRTGSMAGSEFLYPGRETRPLQYECYIYNRRALPDGNARFLRYGIPAMSSWPVCPLRSWERSADPP